MRIRHAPHLARVAALLVMIGIVLALAQQSESAGPGRLRLSRTNAMLGSTITVSGSGWRPRTRVTIWSRDWLGAQRRYGEVRADRRGRLRARYRLPGDMAGGDGSIFACAPRCTPRRSAALHVVAPASRSPLLFGTFLGTFDSNPNGWRRDVVWARNLGARIVQTSLYWYEVERSPGTYDFRTSDRVVRAIRDNGMEVSLNVMGSPRWACAAPDVADLSTCLPARDHLGEYRRFVETVAARYGADVSVWQPVDEVSTEWGQPAPSWTLYADVLATFHDAVKSLDPTSTVLISGLPDGWNGLDDNPPAQVYAAHLIEALAGRHPFDGVAIHPFRDAAPGNTTLVERPGGTRVDLTLKQQLVEFGSVFAQSYGSMPDVWVTSVGWSGCSDGASTLSTADQARYLEHTYRMVLEDPELSFVRSIYWFNVRDYDPSMLSTPEERAGGCLGLANADGSVKPAGDAYRRLAIG